MLVGDHAGDGLAEFKHMQSTHNHSHMCINLPCLGCWALTRACGLHPVQVKAAQASVEQGEHELMAARQRELTLQMDAEAANKAAAAAGEDAVAARGEAEAEFEARAVAEERCAALAAELQAAQQAQQDAVGALAGATAAAEAAAAEAKSLGEALQAAQRKADELAEALQAAQGQVHEKQAQVALPLGLPACLPASCSLPCRLLDVTTLLGCSACLLCSGRSDSSFTACFAFPPAAALATPSCCSWTRRLASWQLSGRQRRWRRGCLAVHRLQLRRPGGTLGHWSPGSACCRYCSTVGEARGHPSFPPVPPLPPA